MELHHVNLYTSEMISLLEKMMGEGYESYSITSLYRGAESSVLSKNFPHDGFFPAAISQTRVGAREQILYV
jgi:hypothetical protein